MTNPPEPTTTAIAPTDTTESKRMWLSPSPEVASRVYDVANIALILSLAIGVVSTVLIVWMGNAKEGHLRREVADAAVKSAEANERAAKANEAAAKANEAAERERLARLKLEEKLSDRKLGRDSADELREIARSFPAGTTLDLCALTVDSVEIVNFCQEVAQAFVAGGWSVRLSLSSGIVGSGINVCSDPAKPEFTTVPDRIVAVFLAEGLVAEKHQFVSMGEPPMRQGPVGPMDAPVRMYIGSK